MQKGLGSSSLLAGLVDEGELEELWDDEAPADTETSPHSFVTEPTTVSVGKGFMAAPASLPLSTALASSMPRPIISMNLSR